MLTHDPGELIHCYTLTDICFLVAPKSVQTAWFSALNSKAIYLYIQLPIAWYQLLNISKLTCPNLNSCIPCHVSSSPFQVLTNDTTVHPFAPARYLEIAVTSFSPRLSNQSPNIIIYAFFKSSESFNFWLGPSSSPYFSPALYIGHPHAFPVLSFGSDYTPCNTATVIIQVCNVFTALLFKISVYDSFASIIISEYKGFMMQVPCIMLCPHFWPLFFTSALISFKTTCCFCTQPWSFSPRFFVFVFFSKHFLLPVSQYLPG